MKESIVKHLTGILLGVPLIIVAVVVLGVGGSLAYAVPKLFKPRRWPQPPDSPL